ncbi:hypothetical protein V2I71_09590 [Peribacillus frigoritolerans]|uniref:hypothetical protein n=1 Tax=Peribacillus frigoritolerans TaxID=450367 RepID=UPI002ED0327A|nr:hypothetical protein V2I71_09590 [Peribacillus frigoritolerans]
MPSSENIGKASKKSQLRALAIDAYITSKEAVVRNIAELEFTYGYKKVRPDGSLTNKFATLMILRGEPGLILHIRKLEEQKGLELQKEVDKILGKVYERNEMQIREKAHEVFIRLDWVNDIEEIKEFIDEAYFVKL